MKKILLFIASGLVAFASVFTFNVSIPSVSASSSPITNNINFTGVTASGNPFEYCSSIYFTASNNWGYSQNLKNSPYTLGGVLFKNATPYASTRPVLVANFSQPLPNAFNYYLYVHPQVYQDSFASDATYNINTYIFVGSTSYNYSNKSFFGNIGVQVFNGELYYIMQFQLPHTGVTKLEIRGANVDGQNAVIPFMRLDYLVEPEESSYTQGYIDGQTDANNTVNINSASYVAGVDQANNTVNTNSASYDAGYTAGSNNAGSLSNLFSGVLEAPVHVVLETLNFEIFGIDVSTFVLSLLTVGFIAIIFKLLL